MLLIVQSLIVLVLEVCLHLVTRVLFDEEADVFWVSANLAKTVEK